MTIIPTKPIVFFDLEGTGLDPAVDRIVEFAAIKIDTALNERVRWSILINPGIPIPKETTGIHGIDDAMVKHEPTFSHYAPKILQFISGCDIGGYNCRNYDIPMLWEELYRCKIEWDLSKTAVIDVGNIFKLKHPRDLTAAVKHYCKRELVGAHEGVADVEATVDVFKAQLVEHEDLGQMPREELSTYCEMEERRVDLQGIIRLNDAGVPVFGTKRNRDVPVLDDIGYAEWMLRGDFPQNTKLAIRNILQSGGATII